MNTVAYNLGQTISSAISQKGEQDTYTFTGAIAQQISFNVLAPGQYRSINAYLYSPSGSQVFSRWLSDQITTPITLTETGQYTLRLDGSGENTDTYNFSLVDLGQVASVTGLTGTPITLGNTVSGSISNTSQVDAYTFTGTVGQQLFYDVLGRDSINFRFFDPTGRVLFNVANPYDRGPDSGLVLTMNGTYRLTLSERIGNYSFRLLDKADATVINLDTDITGTFDNGGIESDSYRFTLTDRSYLYFDKQFGVFDNAWILYGSGGQYITSRSFYQDYSSDSYNDAELWLDSGEYWLILQGNGADGWNGSSNDYKLRIVTPQLNTAPMSLGTTITGTISEQGEQDAYTFEGTAGQQLFYDGFGDANLRFRFFDPIGREIFNMESRYDRAPDNSLTLTMNGTYNVVIDGERDATGSYGFHLFDKADATVINLDTDITGTFDNGGFESDSYRFTLTDRSYLYFDGQLGNYDNAWILYGSGGQYITSKTFYQGQDNNSWNDAELWLESGDYWLILQGNGAERGDGKNDYKLRIVTPQLNTAPMTLGTTITGTISEQGEQDSYTFEGTAGQQLFYDGFGDANLQFRFFDPIGREIFNMESRYDRAPDNSLTLTMNGTYNVVIDGERDATGSYGFHLFDKADATVINLDTDITGTFDNGGFESDSYRFTLTDRSYLYFDGQLGNYDNAWILYGSGGQYITSKTFYQGQDNNSWNDAELWLESGDYWLILQGNGAERGDGKNDYKLRIVTPQLNTAPMTLGTTITGTISKQGEQDTYTFEGTAGQQLFYDALGGDYLKFRFFDPTGRELFNVDGRNDRGSDGSLTLAMNGTYKVVIDGERDATGSYGFRLLDKADATVINLDTDITGTFDNGGFESDSYRFTLTDRTYLYFDGQLGNYDNAWILYGFNGQTITSRYFYQGQGNNSYNDAELWLDSGEYWLILQGNGAERGDRSNDYKLRIVTPQLTTNAYTVGTAIAANISEVGEQDTYTFTGTIGQQLFLDAFAGDPNISISLYSPTGRLLRSSDARTDIGPDSGYTLNEAGIYSLIIDASQDHTGNYSFRLLDKAKATAIAFDQDIIGTFANSGLDSQTYRFTVTMDQYLYFDAQTGDNANYWVLYGNGGQLITYTNLSNDREFWLGKGEYWLVAEGNGGANLDYQFRLVTPDLVTNGLTLGSQVSGNITEAGEQDTYTFTGSVGQQLFFDALVGNSNIKARLYAPSGVLILDKDTNSDWGAFNLGEAGTYRLVIDANGDTTGNYGFVLGDRRQAPVVTLGNAITGQLEQGNQVKLYQINGKAGQQLNFDLTANQWSGANWILYNPSGGIVKAPDLSNPDWLS